MPTLTVTDNNNGTVTYTWSGFTDPGDTILFIKRFKVEGVQALPFQSPNDVQSASFPSGSATVAAPNGLYVSRAAAGVIGAGFTEVEAADPVLFRADDGTASVLDRCYDSAKSVLQALALPFSSNVIDSVHEGKQPILSYPAAVLSAEHEQQTIESVLNGRDDIGQPVGVQLMMSCLKFDQTVKRTLRKWRQSVFRAFHNQRLPGVPESIRNVVEFGDISHVADDAPHAVSDLTIRCITREVRGLGA